MYSIAVKIDGIESRRRSAGVLHIVIGFFMIMNASNYYRFTNYTKFGLTAIFLIIASFSLFYGFFRKKVDYPARYNYLLRLIQAAGFTTLGFLMLKNGRSIDYIGEFVFALLSIMLMFSEKRIFQETTIFLDGSGIKIPGYYVDHIVKWENISEVVIREDFVTIFHIKEK
jgi:hypothetical protein